MESPRHVIRMKSRDAFVLEGSKEQTSHAGHG
jgi:hypothetical protein